MFSTHPDKMRMEPTPERVYSLVRLIAQTDLSKEKLKELVLISNRDISPSSSNTINYTLDVAEKDLGLIRLVDGKYALAVESSILNNPQSFREYVAKRAFLNQDSTFLMFSRWYLSKNEEIFSLGSWGVQAKTAEREDSQLKGIDENAVLGWRFWASYLGLGYLNNTVLIPNMKIRIQDVLKSSFQHQFSYGEAIRAVDFIDWAITLFPECSFKGDLCLGFSAGIRTLEELGLISLEQKMDSDKVTLYRMEGEKDSFSHITVSEEVRE